MSEPRALALAGLAGIGLIVSGYLAAFQLHLVAGVWDPLFGHGSERVLTSGLSRLLPIPDAALGMGAYAVDAILALAIVAGLGPRAWTTRALAAIASIGAAVAVALVVLQPIVAGTFCSLCLLSAALSVVLAIGALTEARERRLDAAVRQSHELEVHR